MKSKTKLFTVMITLFGMPVTGFELAAQDEAKPHTQTHYVVKILNLLGGNARRGQWCRQAAPIQNLNIREGG